MAEQGKHVLILTTGRYEKYRRGGQLERVFEWEVYGREKRLYGTAKTLYKHAAAGKTLPVTPLATGQRQYHLTRVS